LFSELKIIASKEDLEGPPELGGKYPFNSGDKVKINKFIGWQGNEAEYEIVSENGGKKALITSSMIQKI
jgi:hypothetical protein